MTKLTSEDLVHIAKALYREFNWRVYFYIPESYAVERSNLRFSHIHVYEKEDLQYHLPVYTFNNKLYVHTAIVHPLGEGHKVGATNDAGAHYYPPDV